MSSGGPHTSDDADTRLVLGIETSCDETGASVVRAGQEVLSNVIASQHDLHQEFKGVVPEIASRAHAERILPIVRAALSEAGAGLRDIAAVAVGHRPGLIGSLLVGVAAAKALAWSLDVPLVGVDHVHAHLYAGCLNTQPPEFPAIGLVVSGGHTVLYRCESLTEIIRLGSTIDDPVGEAYDKAATILGLPFPGGPNLDTLAQRGDASRHSFPISRLSPDSLDFSFSGLKTALLYAVRPLPHPAIRAGRQPPAGYVAPEPADPANAAAAFQHAAISAVMLKLTRALERHQDCRTVLVGGGVSANSLLRSRLKELGAARGLDVRLPAMEFCVDNAAMIAGLGFHLLERRDWRGDPLTLTAVPTTGC
ncbi:MAG: tRNA (adenosine(37)-N6)-threonylcarbamoyltransferase complex transferase subunit TsaD [Phycisphaerales bacterium]|nr:tRNA (adenosine(37)-N6)-threonylcarbamoyltransferase complex transferase subunit TsaD [Phycisphaerales bacterium]